MSKKNADRAARRAAVEQLRRDQERKERLRGIAIFGACFVVVAGLLGAAIVSYLGDRQERNRVKNTEVAALGADLEAARCDPIITKSAEGNGDHQPVGSTIRYPDAPPAFGAHWGNYLQGAEIRNFWSPEDRPELERVVHSLEHGHTFLWYDDSIAPGSEEYADLEAIATKFDGDPYFNVVPWKATDGDGFPDGKHLALTHWTGPDKQTGVWQYCAQPSGAAVADFVESYPPQDAPEPGAP